MRRLKVRGFLRTAAERALLRLPRRTSPGERLILSYHNIIPSGHQALGDASLHLPIDHFEAQLRMLKAEADVVSLSEILVHPESRARLVAVTFDDAYRSGLRLGASACTSHQVPCTFFVSPGLLGEIPPWDSLAALNRWNDRERHSFLWIDRGLRRVHNAELAVGKGHLELLRIATVDELCSAVTGSGIAIGNHTMNHANLGSLTFNEAKQELLSAQEWLTLHFPNAVLPITAYPYGIAPQSAGALLAAVGLTHGLAVDGGWFAGPTDTPPSCIPRWNVPAGLSPEGFRLRLRGWLAGGL